MHEKGQRERSDVPVKEGEGMMAESHVERQAYISGDERKRDEVSPVIIRLI